MIETQETWLQSLDWEDPPGEKKKKLQPTPVILAGKSHGQCSGSYSSWGHKESNTTEHTHTHKHTLTET